MHRSRGLAAKGRGGPKKGPAPPAEWAALMSAALLMCQIAGDEDEEIANLVEESAAMFSQAKKQKMPAEARFEVLESFLGAIEEFLPSLAQFPEEKAKETQADIMIKELFSSWVGYFTVVYASACSGDSEESSEECAVLLKGLDQILAASIGSEASKLNNDIFQPFYKTIVDLCLKAACENSQETFVRESAAGLLGNLLELHPIGLIRDGEETIKSIVDSCFSLSSDPEDRVLDPDSFSGTNLSTQTLDVLVSEISQEAAKSGGVELPATSEPAFIIFNKAMGILNNASSSEDDQKGALVSFAVLPEPAGDFCKARLKEIMEILKKFYTAASVTVRSAAFIGSAEYFQHLSPEVGAFRTEFLKEILSALESNTEEESVRLYAVQPLIRICSSVDNSSLDSSLVDPLISLIDRYRAGEASEKKSKIAESLLDALGELPEAAPEAFKPFLEKTLTILFTVVGDAAASPSQRASAVLAFQAILDAMGAGALKEEQAATLVSTLSAAFSVPDYGLRGSAFQCFASLAVSFSSLVQGKFAVLTEELMKTLNADYKIKKPKDKAKVSLIKDNGEEEELEEDEEDLEDEDDEDFDEDEMGEFSDAEAQEFEALNEERLAALSLYKSLAEKFGPEFVAEHEKIFPVIFESGRDYSDRVAVQACELLAALKALFPVKANEGAKANPCEKDRERAWICGEALALPDAAVNLLDQSRQMLFYNVSYGEDGQLAQTSLESLTELTLQYGKSFIADQETSVKTACALVKKALANKLACQQQQMGFGEEDEEDEDEEEEEEEEEEGDDEEAGHCGSSDCHDPSCGHSSSSGGDSDDVCVAALDFLCAVARSVGPSFFPSFSSLFPSILKSCDAEDLFGYTFGCFPEFAEVFGNEKFDSLHGQIIDKAVKILNKKPLDDGVARNISFYLGMTVLKSAAAPQILENLTHIGKGLETATAAMLELLAKAPADEEVQACLDNCVSAIGKLLMAHGDALSADVSAPLLDVFFAQLPMKADFEENQFAYAALIKLIASAQSGASAACASAVERHAAHLSDVIAENLALTLGSEMAEKKKITQKLHDFLTKGAVALQALHKGAVEAEAAKWPAEKMKAFQEAGKQ